MAVAGRTRGTVGARSYSAGLEIESRVAFQASSHLTWLSASPSERWRLEAVRWIAAIP